MIHHLLDERKRIDATIARLEALHQPVATGNSSLESKSRRGRKNMSLTEREEVSRRMRNYWESRRREAAGKKEAAKAAGAGE